MAKTPQNKPVKTAPKPTQRSILAAYKEEFSGPLPHPRILMHYEEASKGAAGRIIAMAERQAKHRQDMEAQVISSNIQNERMGMYLAFILTIIIMLTGAYLILNNKSIVGYIAFFAPAIFQAGNYIYNRYAEQKLTQGRKRN